MEKMKKIEVINNRHSGYRRAGLTLERGKNEFAGLTIKQITMLQADPALTVSFRSGKINEESDNRSGANSGADDNSTSLGGDETDGEGESAGSADSGSDESNTKTPATPQLPVELSQAVLAALADPDRLAYFNLDGSPRIAKWREITGLAALEKETVIKAIEAAVPTAADANADTGEGE